MPVRADASAHFRNARIAVTVGNHEYTIPPAPAATWLAILTAEQPDATEIIPGMFTTSEQALFDDQLLAGNISVVEIGEATRDVITIASGHPWWWTLGLVSVVTGEHGTQALGEMARLDTYNLTFGAWLNALYALVVRHMKDQDRMQFDAQLDAPPASVEIDSEDLIDEDAATAAFFGMMNQTNG